MTIRATLLPWSIGVALASGWAHADRNSGWYASFGLGGNYAENSRLERTREVLGFDLGAPVVSAAFGRALGGAWRTEIELAYLHTDPEVLYELDSAAETEVDARDDVTAASLMLNVMRDFQLGLGFRPYLGVGAGMARLEMEVSEVEIDGLFVKRPRRMIIDDRATVPAVQLIAGFSAPLTRQLELAADYRYWHAPSGGLENTLGQSLDNHHTVHSAWLHARYSFAERNRVPAPLRPLPGFYLSTRVGAGFAADANIDDSLDNFDAFDLGPVTVLAAGYHPGGRWRFELEAALRSNHPEVVDFGPEVGQFRARGKVRARSIMANVVYRLSPGAPIQAYAGAGMGIARVEYDVESRGAVFVDDHDSALAAQAILGLDIALSRRVTFSAEYRFWATADLSMEHPDGSPLGTSHQVHGALLGLAYALH